MITEKEKALKDGARSIYDMALETFDRAADLLNLEWDIREHIKYPERILIVNFPVRMDNGRVQYF
jgi:glutamate dehydrogenase (NAD(P)+)